MVGVARPQTRHRPQPPAELPPKRQGLWVVEYIISGQAADVRHVRLRQQSPRVLEEGRRKGYVVVQKADHFSFHGPQADVALSGETGRRRDESELRLSHFRAFSAPACARILDDRAHGLSLATPVNDDRLEISQALGLERRQEARQVVGALVRTHHN
jgi:hypothetical protein